MKLIKCYVSSFGKLKNFEYNFDSRLNTVKEDNGWGKSTFATFIKAMFYGLNDSKRSVAENERIKFRPWNSTEKFGGYVCFEWGGKYFRLERFFGTKESEDTVKLYDDNTGKEYNNTENLGRRIFEIDEEGFLSTTYFSQKDFQVKSNTSITTKFNSVCEIQDSEAFDKALAKVEDKAKTYKYRGDKGLIPDAKRQIYSLDEELKRTEKALSTMKTLQLEVDDLSKEIESLDKRDKQLIFDIEKVSRAEAVAIKKKQFDQLCLEKTKLTETYTSAKDVLRDNQVDVTKVYQLLSSNKDLFGIEAQIETISSDLNCFTSNKSEKQEKKFGYIGYVFAAIAFVVALVLNLAIGFNAIVAVLYVLSGVSVAVLTFLMLSKKHGGAKANGLEQIILDKQSKLIDLKNTKQIIEKEIDEYLSQFNLAKSFDRETDLNNILKVWQVYLDVGVKLSEIDKWLSAYNQQEFTEIANVGDVDALKITRQQIQNQIKLKTRELESKRSSVRFYEDLASSYPDLESKKAELVDKISEYEENQNILKLTAEFLKQADESLKTKYRAPLQNSLSKYFSYIVGDNTNINIDIDLNVTVEENGQQKVTEYYSKGYQNLFEICKRFALVDVLFTGEKPFIILDDPFYNLDDCKLSSAISMIKKLSEEYQIIYLVCHDSRRI